jgi:transposase
MRVVYECCCGLDVHKKSIVACLLKATPGGRSHKEVRTFGTMTADLLALADWLITSGCTHVAMESTGVYWKPVYNLLEGAMEILVVNAQHLKAVPGRKTDVKDAEWIADLLQHGLLHGSFIPPAPQRELRELTRYRTSLVQERAREINRLQKVLEGANIKLASVASSVVGASGRAILEALVGGEETPEVLADLAKGRLRAKREALLQALAGRFRPHQRFLLAQQLAHIDYLDEAIGTVSAEIAERLGPFEEALARLDSIPGIGRQTAEVLLAEVGLDLTRFPTAGNLASWAGLCPGNNESAGKRHSGRTRKGSPWLRTALVEAAQAASRAKKTYLAAQYHRLVARRGRKKALVAVAHSMLVIVYHLLTRGESYNDLGHMYFDQREQHAVERRLTRRLERLGYKVVLEPVA